jgi:hypothetical protein
LGKRDQRGTGKGSYRYSRVVGMSGGCAANTAEVVSGEKGKGRSPTGFHFPACYVVTPDSFTKYTPHSRQVTWDRPPLSHFHIITVVSLSLLIQAECAQGHQKRGSVLMEYGRRQGRPRGVSAAEPPRPAKRPDSDTGLLQFRFLGFPGVRRSLEVPSIADRPGVVFLEIVTL